MADVAMMRLTISRQTLTDAALDTTGLLRVMRERIRDQIHGLVPDARIHWCFSRVAGRAYDLTGLASEDDARALLLANRLRAVRRSEHGYRTMMDRWADDD